MERSRRKLKPDLVLLNWFIKTEKTKSEHRQNTMANQIHTWKLEKADIVII